MKKIRTHYDNLKVARNAPPEVIRAAYRSLSQMYHPDKNPNNPNAQKISAIINAAYEILSDPVKRKEHDTWIEQQENPKPPYEPKITVENVRSNPAPKRPKKNKSFYVKVINVFGIILVHVVRFFWLYLIGGFIIYAVFIENSDPPSGPKPYVKSPEEVVNAYKRPDIAPNGKPWPIYSSYVDGISKGNSNGLSRVTIDNTQNDSDVHVKLVSLNGTNAYPVRQVFIIGKSKFTMADVTAGTYDVRYRDLHTGGLSRTEYFTLKEIEKYDGTEYSDITLTLYKVQNGNMETYALSEDEF